MTIYECDFCGKQRKCRKMQMDNMEYDICEFCDKRMKTKLEGRGMVKQLVHYHCWHWNIWYPQPTITVPTYPITPTITWNANSIGGSYVYNAGNIGGSSAGNSMLLTGTTTRQ